MKRASEYQEQRDLERLALSRHPDATGVKDIQPVITSEKHTDMWLLILTTPQKFHFYSEIVTPEDLTTFQEQRKEQNP